MVAAVAHSFPNAPHAALTTMASLNMEEPLYARVHKTPRNTPEDRQQNSLEAFYGGKWVANQAAFAIQSAFRAYRLRKQVSMKSAAKAKAAKESDNVLDLLILQAAGLQTFSSITNNAYASSHQTQKRNLNRSMSLRVNKEAASKRLLTKTARDDLDSGPSPPPQPCPALRGHYGEIPKPPQRTVSFLGRPTLPQKLSHQQRPLPPPPPPGPVMAFSTGRIPPKPASAEPHQVVTGNHHLRSYSSPAEAPIRSVVIDIPEDPLPPPPYISPPLPLEEPSSPSPLPPLPPPPELFMDEKPKTSSRPPCDSSSSASSIDSGFRSSYLESPTSWSVVASPTTTPSLMSPEATAATATSPAVQNVVFEPRMHLQSQCESSSVLYGTINKPTTCQVSAAAAPRRNYSSNTLIKKKSVKFNPEGVLMKDNQLHDEVTSKRQYRVGLNLFNQCPELGMEYLLKKEFVNYSPASVGKFLLGRKGFSKSMVGQYLCQIQRPFNLAALHCFVHELDFSGLHLDIALRNLYKEISPPSEAQKVEKVMEVFAKRYIACNQMFAHSFRSADTIFVLSYAIVLLNTDLHSKSLRPGKRMKKEDFVRNLKGADLGADLDSEMLYGIYDRIKANQLKAGVDHVSQVARVEEMITKKDKATLPASSLAADTSRRLVSLCRLTEVPETKKAAKLASKSSSNAEVGKHQRAVFLFNDLLVITKSVSKKEKTIHQFRSTLSLKNLRVNVFSTAQYQFGIQLQDKLTGKVTVTFNARSEEDQQKFVNDMEESIHEMTEMERAKSVLNDNLLNQALDDEGEAEEDAYETLC